MRNFLFSREKERTFLREKTCSRGMKERSKKDVLSFGALWPVLTFARCFLLSSSLFPRHYLAFLPRPSKERIPSSVAASKENANARSRGKLNYQRLNPGIALFAAL